MPTTQEIVQQIRLEGQRSMVQQFVELGSAGAAAFQTVGQGLAKATAPLQKFQTDLSSVEKTLGIFSKAVGTAVNSISSLTSRMTAVGAGVAASGALIARGALQATVALRAIRDSLIEQRLAASQNARQQKQNVATDFSNANSLQDLRREYIKGGMSIEDYTKQLTEMNFQQERARVQHVALQHEQEELRKEQAKDMAETMRRSQQLRLEAQFGASLATTLERLAGVLEQVRNKFFAAFGPKISEFLLSIANAINSNADTFIKLFEKMGLALEAAFAKAGITTEKSLTGIVAFGQDLVKAITTIVIPAFAKLFTVIQGLADALNNIFGTKFTASSIVAIALILKFTGILGALSTAIGLVAMAVRFLLSGALGPIGIAISIIVTLLASKLIPLLLSLDWKAIAAVAVAAWKTINDTIQGFVDGTIAAWNSVVAFFGEKIAKIVGFFKTLIDVVREFLGLTGGSAVGSSLSKEAGLNDIGTGLARGGLFRGRAGKDTNLAWLTDREYVINPKAVQHWGVGFLNAINAMANPLRGFNAGGLVSPMMQMAGVPRFAGGGLNVGSSGRPLVLKIGDAEFSGLTVQDDTADSMARYAARRGVRSTGRRPVWFGGSR